VAEVDAGTTGGRDEAMRGTTPLMYAAGSGCVGVVRLLLERGAEVGRRNALGETALHWAGVSEAEEEEEEGAEVIRILAKGLDVNVRNSLGGTPLHIAAYRGRLGNVRTLLELGADPRAVTTNIHYDRLVGVKGTPEEIARGEGYWEVADFIREWESTHPTGGVKGEGVKADGGVEHGQGGLGIAGPSEAS
jgi:ankyrin repeat protein